MIESIIDSHITEQLYKIYSLDIDGFVNNQEQVKYLQPIITQYFIDNKSEIWLLFLIAHSKRWRFNAFIDY